jgi:hypothetical protein
MSLARASEAQPRSEPVVGQTRIEGYGLLKISPTSSPRNEGLARCQARPCQWFKSSLQRPGRQWRSLSAYACGYADPLGTGGAEGTAFLRNYQKNRPLAQSTRAQAAIETIAVSLPEHSSPAIARHAAHQLQPSICLNFRRVAGRIKPRFSKLPNHTTQ